MLNHIELHGRLGRDPELTERQGQNGPYKRVTFSLAVDRDFGDGCDWFYCVMNGNRAAVIDKWFSRGSEIIVTGRMESYHPKNDPNNTAWLVKMDGFDFAGSNSSGSPNNSSSTGSFKPVTEEPNFNDGVQSSFDDLPDSFQAAEDDIPF